MLYGTKEDEDNEKYILDILQDYIVDFGDLEFRHKKGTSTFDYHGYKDGKARIGIDVKIRDIASDDYENYFLPISKYKYAQNKNGTFYMCYCFLKDRKIRLYGLSDPEIKEKEITFFHKRAKKKITKEVCLIPARNFVWEAYLN